MTLTATSEEVAAASEPGVPLTATQPSAAAMERIPILPPPVFRTVRVCAAGCGLSLVDENEIRLVGTDRVGGGALTVKETWMV